MAGRTRYVWIWFYGLLLGLAHLCAAQSEAAAELIEKGHWKRARVIVEARLRETPDDAAAHFYRSQIRNAFGDLSSPLPEAERAVALEGDVARFHR